MYAMPGRMEKMTRRMNKECMWERHHALFKKEARSIKMKRKEDREKATRSNT